MAAKDDDDLEDFLRRVSEISDIVSKLNSNDDNVRDEAIRRADLKLNEDKIKYDRTVINQKAFDDASSDVPSCSTCMLPETWPQNEQCTPELFMEQMEKDAKERAKDKKEKEKEAQGIKEKGNIAYRNGSFSEAIEFYSQAIHLVRDCAIFYTNRAQAYYKCQMYENAKKDCEAALFLSKNNCKAELLMANILFDTEQWEDAQICFDKVLEMDPTKANLISKYTIIIKAGLKRQDDVKRISSLIRDGNEKLCSVSDFLKKLKNVEYYDEIDVKRIHELTTLINNSDARILFRIEGGFEFLKEFLTSGEIKHEIWIEIFDLSEALIKENSENQKFLLELNVFNERVMASLELSDDKNEKFKVVNFLHTLSIDDSGRNHCVNAFDSNKLVKYLISGTSSPLFSMNASILNNLALNESFRNAIKDSFENILLPRFHKVIELSEKLENGDSTSCITLFSNLSLSEKYRVILVIELRFWDAGIQLLASINAGYDHAQIAHAVLGLMINLGKENFPECIKSKMKALLQELVPLLDKPEMAERACDVLHCVIKSFEGAVKTVLELDLVPISLSLLELGDQPIVGRALKILVSLSRVSRNVQKEIAHKNLPTILKLFESNDDCVIGNAALCIVHCLKVTPTVERLEKTDVVATLLTVIKNENIRNEAKKNSAILLAKLSAVSQVHLNRLRSLKGIEILHANIPPPDAS